MALNLVDLVNNTPATTSIKKPMNIYMGLAAQAVQNFDTGQQEHSLAQEALNNRKRTDWREGQYKEVVGQYQQELDGMQEEGHFEKYSGKVRKLASGFANDSYLKAMEEEHANYSAYVANIQEGVKSGDYSANDAKYAMAVSRYSTDEKLTTDEFGNIKGQFNGVEMRKYVNKEKIFQDIYSKLKEDQSQHYESSALPGYYDNVTVKGLDANKLREMAYDLTAKNTEVGDYMRWQADLEVKANYLFDENGQKRDIELSDLQALEIVNAEGNAMIRVPVLDEQGKVVYAEDGSQKTLLREVTEEEKAESKLPNFIDEYGVVNQDYAKTALTNRTFNDKVRNFMDYADTWANQVVDRDAIEDVYARDSRKAYYESQKRSSGNGFGIDNSFISNYDNKIAQLGETKQTNFTTEELQEGMFKNGFDGNNVLVSVGEIETTPEYAQLVKGLESAGLTEEVITPLIYLEAARKDAKIDRWDKFLGGALAAIGSFTGAGYNLMGISKRKNAAINWLKEDEVAVFNQQLNQMYAKYGKNNVDNAVAFIQKQGDNNITKALSVISKQASVLPNLGTSHQVDAYDVRGGNVRMVGNQAVLTTAPRYNTGHLQQQLGKDRYQELKDAGKIIQYGADDDKTSESSIVVQKVISLSVDDALNVDEASLKGKAFNSQYTALKVTNTLGNEARVADVNNRASLAIKSSNTTKDKLFTQKLNSQDIDVANRNDALQKHLETLEKNINNEKDPIKRLDAIELLNKKIALIDAELKLNN